MIAYVNILAGFDLEIAGLFDINHFREQIKEFIMRLYMECDDHTSLNARFTRYFENKLPSKGITERVVTYVKELF